MCVTAVFYRDMVGGWEESAGRSSLVKESLKVRSDVPLCNACDVMMLKVNTSALGRDIPGATQF